MSPCTGCHSGCCRAFAVPVTGADILRIERDLGWSFWEFVCRWEDKDGKIAGAVAPHFHFADEPQTPFAICLLQNASRYFSATGKCRFLIEEPPTPEKPLGTAHCGIYYSRPMSCRVFPTTIRKGAGLAELHDVPERGRPAEQGDIYQLCPRPWEPADVDPLTAPQDLVVLRYEMQFFSQIAESWNKTPGEWKHFPEFLRLVYNSRVKPIPQEAVTLEFKPAGQRLARAA